jgi:tetratricopeptide (TPR) repeat protein
LPIRVSDVPDDASPSREQARLLLERARALDDEDRFDEAIACCDELAERFAGSDDPEIRPVVSWGWWTKSDALDELGRAGECVEIYDTLVRRGDERQDPELRPIVAWCLWELARRASVEDDQRRRHGLLRSIVERFERVEDPALREDVADALYALATEADSDLAAVAVWDEIIDRFADATERKLKTHVVRALRYKGSALTQMGRGEEALAMFDAALAKPLGDEVAAQLLYGKHSALRQLRRRPEAIVVADSLVARVTALAGPARDAVLPEAIIVLMERALDLRLLDPPRHDDDHQAALRVMLDDIQDAQRPAPRPKRCPEELLAQELAAAMSADLWFEFLAGVADDDATRARMGARAVELFELASPWLDATGDDQAIEPSVAAALLRDIANGHAVMSRWWPPENRAQLPLPLRALAEHAIHGFGLEDWAAELGHPLALDDDQDPEDPPRGQTADSDEDDHLTDGLARVVAGALDTYDLLAVLQHSPAGRAALRTGRLREWTAWRVSDALSWAVWVNGRDERVMVAAAVMSFIAEAWFRAAHSAAQAPPALSPDRRRLRDLTAAGELEEWFADRDLHLPAWFD